MPGYGWGRKFGWRGGFGPWRNIWPMEIPPFVGPGRGRWIASQQFGDPERMMFGLGPCGEYAYQQYKRMKQQK